jgi:hypothetical protein
MKFLFVFIYLFSSVVFCSDKNISVQEPSQNFIDTTHKSLSSKIKEWAVDLDFMLLGVYDYFDDNESHPAKDNRSILFINEANLSGEESTAKDRPVRPFISTEEVNASCEIEEVSVLDENVSKTSPFTEDNASIDLNASAELEDVNCSSIDLFKSHQTGDENMTSSQMKDEGIDEFFLTRTLLEERDKSYVRLSFLQSFNSLAEEEFQAKLRARVYFTQSRKRFKLFVENLDEDNVENIGKSDDDNPASFGIEKESTKRLGIKPRYSIGFKGIDPFARARFSYETDFGSWHFKPVQTFQYSLEEEFSEITELYFDKYLNENLFFRFVVDRGTKTDTPGMRYDSFIQLFYKTAKQEGLSFNLGFNGSTKYQQEVDLTVPPIYEDHNKVYNYLFLLRYRQNIWKKWFFYEIAPGVNYHEIYDYRPNYNINFRIDLFFGHV